MNLFSINILGIRVTASPKEEILEFIKNRLIASEKTHPASLPRRQAGRIPHHNVLTIVTPNPEQIVLAQKDSHFAAMLNGADLALPDGIGLVLAARILGFPHSPITLHASLTRIPGVEFMEELVGLAATNGWPVALIGGREGVAEEALLRLKKKYLGLTGWVEEPGAIINTTPAKRDPRCCNPNKNWEQHRDNTTNDQFYQYTQKIIDKIKKTHTKLVFIGLGAPKQEYFMDMLREGVMRDVGWGKQKQNKFTHSPIHPFTHPLILMSVGGSFDFIAGRTRRAPLAVQVVHLEWLWRLVREPWRWRRQLALLKFLWLIVFRKLA